MAVTSRHNKYTSIPDWFSGQSTETASTVSPTTTQTIYVGNYSGVGDVGASVNFNDIPIDNSSIIWLNGALSVPIDNQKIIIVDGKLTTSTVVSPSADGLWELRQTEDGQDYAYTTLPVVTQSGITTYSQKSLKNILDEQGLSLDELNTIKPIRYTWKDNRDNRIHIGGIADDIFKVLPEVIYKTDDGTLTMDYGNAAFAIAASLIKLVTNHESRIKMLEEENKKLKLELERLKTY